MNARLRSLAFSIAVVASTAALGACGGGGSSHAPSALPATGGTPGVTPQGSAPATFTLTVRQYAPAGTSANHRQAAFVSPATAQISLTLVSVNGQPAGGAPMTFPVSPNAQGCAGTNGVVTCTLNADLPIGSDVFTASTLDANGRTLGSSTIAATVVQNATNSIELAVGGQIANLQLYLSQNHFTPGTPANADVIVVPLDQSGAEIVNPGNYNPAITVTSSSSAGGHLSLIADGANTGQTATLNSPNDQVVIAYDGGGTAGSSNIIAAAGAGITQTQNVSISSAGLHAAPSGPQLVSSTGYIFTTAGQSGTIVVSGGTAPYTVTSSDTTLATLSGSGPYTITANGYGVAGSATITVTDSLGADSTIPVTFIAPAIALTPGSCGGTSCSSTGVSYSIPLSGPAGALPPTTVTASGGTGSYAYFFISSGTVTSQYATAAQGGNTFTITPSGFGNDAMIVSSGNQTAYFAITASADAFGQTLPRAIGFIVENTGKFYSATLPATVTGAVAAPSLSGFTFNAGSPPSIDAQPATPATGTLTFTSNFGSTVVPYTVFGLTFPSYTGSGASSSSELATPADEAFTGIGESETITVAGLSGNVSAQSSNTGVVTAAAASSTTITVTAAGSGTAAITLTDSGTGASATYTASVTTTTVPIAGLHRSGRPL